jgi:hypothetical protein
MQREVLRLECLKLANAPNRPPAQVVEFAKIFEDYLSAEDKPQDANVEETPRRGPGRPRRDEAHTPQA